MCQIGAMPILDMPLEELRRYSGRNPKPADFDDYWRRGLDEMRSIDPAVRLDPVASPAGFCECFDLTFTGVGNARIYAKYVRPTATQGPHPAVLEFHGYSGRSCDWCDAYKWAAHGYSFFALDCRGQGGRSEDVGGVKGNTLYGHIIRGLHDQPDKLLYRSIFLDCAQLANIAMGMPEVDPDRIGATGGSQGGGLTLACAALEPRIRRAAPVFPFLCDYQRVWELDLAKDAYSEIRDYFRRFDPLHQREEQIWTTLGYIDNQHLAPRIRAEVLMAIGLMDSICPPSTQFAAYNKISSSKSMLVYHDYGHEGLPGVGDHIFEFMSGL